ncbi:hypothetical protein DL96DRAFT_1600338 [Flagelloscypha sp. PMI_526]|nr:hypothetical protein DL96DRAFT_1600338 [Flagelloscypha sp. PMI_526]
MARKIWILIENSWARDNFEDIATWLQIIMNSGKDTQHVVESIYHVKTRPILVVELPSGVPLDLLLGEHDPNAFLKPPWRGGPHDSSPVIIFEYVTKGNLKVTEFRYSATFRNVHTFVQSLRNSWNEYAPKKPFQNSSQLQSFPVMNPYPPPKCIPTRPGNNPPSSIPSHWVKKLVSPPPPPEPEHQFNGFGENDQDNHGPPTGNEFAEDHKDSLLKQDNLGGIQNAESKETILKTGKFHPTSSCAAYDKPHNYAKKEEDPMPLPSPSKLKDEDLDSGSSDIFYQLNGLGKYRPVEPTEVALDKFGTHIKTEAQDNQTSKVEADGLDYYLSLLPPSKQKEDIGKERPKEESMELDLEDVKPAVVSLENLGKRTRATSISQPEKDTKRPRFQKTSPQSRQRRNSDLGLFWWRYSQFEPLPPDSRNSAQDGSSFQIGSSYWFRNLPEAIQTSLLVRIETRPEDRYLDNVYLNAIGRLAAVGIGETISVAFDQESIRTIHAPFVQPVPPSAEETGQVVAVLDGPLKNQVAVVRDWEDEDTGYWLCQMART